MTDQEDEIEYLDEYSGTDLNALFPSRGQFNNRVQLQHPARPFLGPLYTTDPSLDGAMYVGYSPTHQHQGPSHRTRATFALNCHQPATSMTWWTGYPVYGGAITPVHVGVPCWVPTRYRLPNMRVYRCNCVSCRHRTRARAIRPRGNSSHLWVFVVRLPMEDPADYIVPILDWICETTSPWWTPYRPNSGPHRIIPRPGFHDHFFWYPRASDPLFPGQEAIYLPFQALTAMGRASDPQ